MFFFSGAEVASHLNAPPRLGRGHPEDPRRDSTLMVSTVTWTTTVRPTLRPAHWGCEVRGAGSDLPSFVPGGVQLAE